MAPDSQSNIRVFVRWHDQTVFAGEDIKCTITFKNVAAGQAQPPKQPQTPQLDRSRLASPLHNRNKGHAGLSSPPSSSTTARGHRRSALSLSAPPSSSRNRSGSIQWPQPPPSAGENRHGHAHKRSVSIVSIGSTSTIDDHHQRTDSMASARSQRQARGHSRASSLQIMPRAQISPGPQSANFSPRNHSSPLFNASYPPDRFGRLPGTSTAPNTPAIGPPRKSPRGSPNPMPEFRFPAAPPPEDAETPTNAIQPPIDGLLSPGNSTDHNHGYFSRQRESISISDKPAPAARILSSTSLAGGTPRSSGEFYSVSNHSSETLASEYPSQPLRGHGRPPHFRRTSGISPLQPKVPESLMMGFAQVQGSFSLDGSLVSLSPFDQVKKKGVVGGRGGGVVGLESPKRDSGLLRGFGWGSISTSIGDLLGGSELSTIKEMRGAANSKSVPLLSTPQSILFVDLQLAPGESRAFEYTFKLPRGLPPTHKGKAVKIWYSVIIGTQRVGGAKEQQIKTVDIPFRVLGSVNSYGEVLGHDLSNPYVLLRDEALVNTIAHGKRGSLPKPSRGPAATMNDFLTYVDDLVSRPRDERDGLLSPTAVPSSRRPSLFEDITSAKEAIHLAIMKSNMTAEGQQSPNRFEISRNGQRVGVLMLTRPAYRLGEVVTMAIDFSDADIPCYAVHSTLETSEKVDPSLAVRSESSIQRVTRKVYTTSAEATLFSRRIVFTPTIPITATPEFVTSGVSLEWKIRVEFVVPSQGSGPSSPGEQRRPHPLLEQISRDEKGGLVLVAVERLGCESFDVSVPLRVYGAVGTGLERLERDEASEEGLAI
ncbi:intracellular protein transport protein [Stachybotrys elegans]|uniref:Intracellular protein transport protein n=1 Tax=Stachybotrys elegans TaxID=80388 RepID=A0A8K0SY90_9HYPO|nr:intracellular protein transport protein [Stachybotrys elegans]